MRIAADFENFRKRTQKKKRRAEVKRNTITELRRWLITERRDRT